MQTDAPDEKENTEGKAGTSSDTTKDDSIANDEENLETEEHKAIRKKHLTDEEHKLIRELKRYKKEMGLL